MNYLLLLIVICTICAIAIAFEPTNSKKSRSPLSSIQPSALLTEREKKMFIQLRSVFLASEYIVLTQVAFSALLSAPRREIRAKFNRKRTDFVIASANFSVLAIIELDDSSHHGRELEDAERDSMLIQAGYRVVRFAKIPKRSELAALKKTLLS